MPLTKRQGMKRTMKQAIAAVDKSAAYLLQLREIYEEALQQGSRGSEERIQAIDALLQVHVNLLELMRAFESVI